MNTAEREAEMDRLRRITTVHRALLFAPPIPRELEISAQYPTMPRERVLWQVAEELVK